MEELFYKFASKLIAYYVNSDEGRDVYLDVIQAVENENYTITDMKPSDSKFDIMFYVNDRYGNRVDVSFSYTSIELLALIATGSI